MKPLIVLLVVFVISVIVLKILQRQLDFSLAARIAMAAMLCFSAIGHFIYIQGMSMMIPEIIPFKQILVLLTGFFEIAAALSLLIPRLQVFTAWILIVFLILVLPANIYAAIKQVDYQNGTYQGNSSMYLWFRIPLQFFFILWIYFSAIKHW